MAPSGGLTLPGCEAKMGEQKKLSLQLNRIAFLYALSLTHEA
jgi:hypothetical protein